MFSKPQIPCTSPCSAAAIADAHRRFNHAIPGSTAHDLKSQAEALVAHLKASPEVDFEKDWKVITVFVGGNDLCDYHMRPGTYEPDNFTRSLQEVRKGDRERVEAGFRTTWPQRCAAAWTHDILGD